jgi:hypothetical protein
MRDNPENANAACQGGAHVVRSQPTSGTITVPGLFSQKEKVHHGWFAISEESFRKIERAYDDMGTRRKAKAALTTVHRIANLKGLTTFVEEIAAIAKDMDYSYPHAEEGLKLLERLNLLVIKRRQVPGSKLKAPSEYTIFPPIEQNVLSIEPTSKFPEGSRVPKNPLKNTQERDKNLDEVAFSSLKEAIAYFIPLFPDRPVKLSLSDLVRKKGKEYLTASYCHNWLTIERRRRLPNKQPTTTYEEPPVDPEAERERQGQEQENRAAALAELAKFRALDGFKATGLEAEEDEEEIAECSKRNGSKSRRNTTYEHHT